MKLVLLVLKSWSERSFSVASISSSDLCRSSPRIVYPIVFCFELNNSFWNTVCYVHFIWCPSPVPRQRSIYLSMWLRMLTHGRGQLKYDGTRAETRFRLSTKRASPFKSAGASVQSTTGSRGVRISFSNAGYTMFRDSVKGTGYPLHSPVSPSLPLLCVTVCHHIATGLYLSFSWYLINGTIFGKKKFIEHKMCLDFL